MKVAKLLRQLVWHKHDDEGELFQIVRGRLEGERSVDIGPGEFCVVPRDVMRNPFAEWECSIVLIEIVTTKHTGDVVVTQTRSIEAHLARRYPGPHSLLPTERASIGSDGGR